jgi:hypothetical protein
MPVHMAEERQATIVIAGVLARGVRPTGHVPFQRLERNVIQPLKDAGFRTRLWGFNNIPTTIDGDAVPADGAKSYFPEFDHYEEWKQEDIDAFEWTKERAQWLSDVVFTPDCKHKTMEIKEGIPYHSNIVRRDWVLEQARSRIVESVVAAPHSAADLVVLVYPAMLIAPLTREHIAQAANDNALVCLVGGKRWASTNGFLMGTAQSVMRWFAQRESVTRRHKYYEQWWSDSMRGMDMHCVRPGRQRGKWVGRHKIRLRGCQQHKGAAA